MTSRAACCALRRRSMTSTGSRRSDRPEGKPDAPKSQQRMRKGIADLHRRTETSQACNDRYLRAMASAADTTPLGELTARLGRPVRRKGRRVRPMNPCAPNDARLIETVSRGEFVINGFRNRDLRAAAVRRCAGFEGRTTPPRRGGVAPDCAAAGTPAGQKGSRDTPLRPVRQREDHRHGIDLTTKHWDGSAIQISSLGTIPGKFTAVCAISVG